jgi:hypothetical protein
VTTDQTPPRRKPSPLLCAAVILSVGSLAWTTWSLFDLLGAGPIGLTVAAGSDIIWASVIIAEARGLHIRLGKKQTNIVPIFGWAALLVVAGFLAWHGITENSAQMAVAGPFLPLGAKAVWVLALADMRDPSALTDADKAVLAEMERGLLFEEKEHGIQMRRREMDADLVLSEVETDFRIELRRQDKTRELFRRRPLELGTNWNERTTILVPANANDLSEANNANGANNPERARPGAEANDQGADSEQFARIESDTTLATITNGDTNTAGHPADSPRTFGFSAALPDANSEPSRSGARSPRGTNANPPTNTNTTATANDREAAANKFRESVANGEPLSGAELGRLFGRTPRWGQKVIADLKAS